MTAGSMSQLYWETVVQPSTSAQPRKPSTSTPAASPPQRRSGPDVGRPTASLDLLVTAARHRDEAVVAGAAATERRVDLECRPHQPRGQPRRRTTDGAAAVAGREAAA